MPDAIEEMIKVSAMYGFCSIGAVARFTGAVLRGARVLWGGELRNVDDLFNVEVEEWLA